MLNIEDEKEDYKKLEIESISDLLIELDSIKRELSDQIEMNKAIKSDKTKLKQEYQELENEMNQTIQSYQEVIESLQVENTGDYFKVKKQLVEQQNLTEKLQMENSRLNESILLLTDENKTFMKKIETLENSITKLNKKVHKYKNQNGIPSSQVK